MRPDLCIYHAPCQDGFTAAWAIWTRWPDVEFHPGVYGQCPPDVAGKDVLLVDFSYKKPVLLEMANTARTISVLDHHKSAEADLAAFAVDELEAAAELLHNPPGQPRIQALFDMGRSGARMAWEFSHPDEPAPRLVLHVEDRDLWRFAMNGTREVCADLFSRPYDFWEWDRAFLDLAQPDTWRARFQMGEAIERKHHKDIAELLALTARQMVIGDHRVKVANLPYTLSSDAANILAEGQPFGACYYDNAEGRRVFSLRSKPDGADVSAIAVRYGGGGHARAAGFSAPLGWEGDIEFSHPGVMIP